MSEKKFPTVIVLYSALGESMPQLPGYHIFGVTSDSGVMATIYHLNGLGSSDIDKGRKLHLEDASLYACEPQAQDACLSQSHSLDS